MLFERRLQQGLVDGSIRVVFRRWRRAQVVAGRRYRSPIGMVIIDAISIVHGAISNDDANAAGYDSAPALLEDLRGPGDGAIYRLELHLTADADPRHRLAASDALDEVEARKLQRRLERLDRTRAWTMETLLTIQERPGVRAGDLYAGLGWPDLATFKAHVRQLKDLGLTLSLRVGYRVSPRGEAYLQHLQVEAAAGRADSDTEALAV